MLCIEIINAKSKDILVNRSYRHSARQYNEFEGYRKLFLYSWATKELQESSKRKQKLFHKFLKFKTNKNGKEYKAYKSLFEIFEE